MFYLFRSVYGNMLNVKYLNIHSDSLIETDLLLAD